MLVVLIRGCLRLSFTWDDGEIEDRVKVSTSPFFEGLLINNIKLQDILMRAKCMAIQIWLEIKWQIYESRDTYGTRFLVYFRLYESKFKVTPIQRHYFKVHFDLEFRGNRGSSQNFHEAPFQGYCKIITPSRMVTPFLLSMQISHI